MSDRNDLTQGTIWKKLLIYFLPIVAGTLFQQLYNTVDAVILSKFVGTQAQAAVGGSPAMLINLLLGFFIALSSGAAIVIAQHYGAKRFDAVNEEIHTSITFCGITGIAMGALIIIFARPILLLLKTPADTLTDAVTYTQIYFGGSFFALVFNMASGIMRAMGNSRRPFVYLVISCILNIALDLIFVLCFNLGVSGVAWATFISQAISCVLALLFLLFTKDESYRLKLNRLCIKGKILANMMRIGIPAGVQSAMYGVSNLILQIGINTLGTVVVSSWSMSGKIDGLYWATAGAFGTAVMNFVGQNYGAGQGERIHKCVRIGMALFSAITVSLCVIILLLAKPLLAVFTDDIAVQQTTWTILTYFVPYYLLWTVIEIFSGVLRGVGDAVKPMIILALGVCLLRIIWVLTAFKAIPTLQMLSACYPISWSVTDIALLVYYFKGSRLRGSFTMPRLIRKGR